MAFPSALHFTALTLLTHFRPGHSFSPVSIDVGGIARFGVRKPSPSPSSIAMAADADEGGASTTAPQSFATVDGISSPEILNNYDTFLLDMWGGEWEATRHTLTQGLLIKHAPPHGLLCRACVWLHATCVQD